MTNPVTPNIGLNKIDRTSPTTTYFDLEKYIDQNADTVDRFAGEASQAIEALQQRLDTEERREVVLQPGLQIVNAERSAPFSLSGIKGRTLVNLLGRDGNCEDLSKWHTTPGISASLDTVNNTIGTGGIKLTLSSANGSLYKSMALSQTKSYLFVADLKNGNAAEMSLSMWNGSSNISGTRINSTSFKSAVLRVPSSSVGAITNNLQIGVTGATAQFGYVDAVRAYEISNEEYDALDSMTPEQIAAKYPYVDSVQPVRNPYTIRYGENLLPPFYEWVISPNALILSPYHLSLKSATEYSGTYVSVPCLPNTTYTLQGIVIGNGKLYADIRNSLGDHEYHLALNGSVTFTTSEESISIDVIVTNDTLISESMQFKNPMLTLGSTPIPFKPREDSMLALQTDLYADPLTGAYADEVFEKDGQYFKLGKWRNFTLDGEQIYAIHSSKFGFKWVQFTIPHGPRYNGSNVFYMSKFNGSSISHIPGSLAAGTLPDQIDYDPGSKLVYMSVSNTDSGWGDNYTPTSDEIKAYFMGWTMYDGTGGGQSPNSNQYTGTGTKWWARRSNGVDRVWLNATNILPTVQAPNWTPYQLVYQLVSPMIEPIVSEGMLTFNEGPNQIEVGTGIVLRESAKPKYYLANGNYYINNTGVRGSLLKNKVSLILRVYRNGRVYNPAKIENDVNAYGKQHVRFLPSDFDPSETYYVTYLMFGMSPTVPFTGSYPANEKTLLEKLTDAVQKNASAVSVLMNKKADKDAPGWITPTLLNGWASRNTGYDAPLSYRKIDGLGVQVRGIIQLGTTGTVFFLPDGYRPEKTHFCNVMGYMQSQASYIYPYITVTPDGDFRIDAVTSPPTWLIIDTIIPL